jgi:hypothetical protein
MVTINTSTKRVVLVFLSTAFLVIGSVHAFTANSLEITIDKQGDAIAIFQFSLEGLVENAIPQSMLEDQLLKGMSSSSNPPELVSMDRSSATIRMKKFADISDVPPGMEYRTASMDFKKGEIALQNSGLSSIITADFSPAKVILKFPDNYSREFFNSDTLPSITHTIIDPTKHPGLSNDTSSAMPTLLINGAIKIVSSPPGVQVFVDGMVVGTTPNTFSDIPAGSHTLQFSKVNYTSVSKTVTVKAGQTVPVSVFLPIVEPTPKPAPGFAGAMAAFSIGIVVMVTRGRT